MGNRSSRPSDESSPHSRHRRHPKHRGQKATNAAAAAAAAAAVEDRHDVRVQLGVKMASPWTVYERHAELGEGGFSTIFRGRNRNTGESVAIKVLDKGSKHSRDTFFIEVKLLRAIGHENVVKILGAYEDKDAYYIILELQRGRDLFDVLDAKRDVFPEVTAAKLLETMVSAVQYCHAKQIVHLDLKPENFVFSRANDLNKLVLVDFGLGRVVRDDATYRDRVGSMQYIAPEMIDEDSMCTGLVLKACDMWSIGVILYIMVTGLIPFANWDEVKYGKLRLSKSMSRELRHLLRGLLTRDVEKRLTAEEVLRHPFIIGQRVENNPIYQAIGAGVKLLRRREQPHLLRSVAQGMVLPMSLEDRHEIDALFTEFDTNGDGRLDRSEFGRLLEHMDVTGSTAVKIAGHDEEEEEEEAEEATTAGSAGAPLTATEMAGGASRARADSGDAGAAATDQAGRPRGRSHDELLEEVDHDGDGQLGRKDLAHLAAIGMLALRTPMAKKRIAFAFGNRKSKPFVTRNDLRQTLKSVPSTHLRDLFVCEDSNEVRSRIPVEQFATAVLQRS